MHLDEAVELPVPQQLLQELVLLLGVLHYYWANHEMVVGVNCQVGTIHIGYIVHVVVVTTKTLTLQAIDTLSN